MQITCPSCAARYILSPAALGEKGRTVRCAKCGNTWFAAPEAPQADSVQEPAAAPDPVIAAANDFSTELRARMDAPVTSFQVAVPKRKKAKTQLPGFVRTDSSGTPRRFLAALAILVALAVVAVLLWIFLSPAAKQPPASPAGIVSYNGKGLDFLDVKALAEGKNGAYTLILRGAVHNSLNMPVALPALSAKILDTGTNQTVEWIFHLPQTTLAPGEKASFEISKTDLKFIGNQLSLSFVLEK